jgi:hypothetical protein
MRSARIGAIIDRARASPENAGMLAAHDLDIPHVRQSPAAAAVQRGVCRMLRASGFATVCEFPLASGRRADVIAVDLKGAILIVEIKSSPADYRADGKWREYRDYCDHLYFAIPPEMPRQLIAEDAGLIVADAWGAEILRHPEGRLLPAARRKAVTLRFARLAALRLHSLNDPNCMV